MLKERPILFNGDMVRALLDGRKTQTRRILKSQPPEGCGHVETGMYAPIVIERNGEEQPGPEIFGAFSEDGEWSLKCPYGQPGDRLWVREAWRVPATFDPLPGRDFVSDQVWYDAEVAPRIAPGRYRHARFMPRWASRITLEIVSVRVERLKNISEADAQAEGVDGEAEAAAAGLTWYDKPRRAFTQLWQRINGADSWNANPWVWVVEFKRMEANQ